MVVRSGWRGDGNGTRLCERCERFERVVRQCCWRVCENRLLDGPFEGLFEECSEELIDDGVCAAAKVGRHFCHDKARTSGPAGTSTKGKSPFFFSFGFCACVL